MKIALLSDSVYPFNKGGKETRSYDLAIQLRNKGHEVHFYTMKFWKGENTINDEGIFFHSLCKNYPLYSGKGRSIKQGIMFGLSAFKLIKENFDIIDADHMVYFHLFPTKIICLIKNKPLIITWHEVWGKYYWKEYMGKKGIIGFILEKISSKLPNKIISISKHTTNKLSKNLNADINKIVTIPNGIDFKEIQKIKPSKETSDVIFAGRLLSHKNIDLLIKSLPKEKKLIIIGDGPEKENLTNLAKSLNKKIVFKGFIDKNKEVISLIKSSKVFVLPSTREGFGIVVIEANACGIPVITTNHKDNASKDLISQGKNGYISNLNEKSISENILKAIKNYKNMKKDCLKTAKINDWDNLINKFEEVYQG